MAIAANRQNNYQTPMSKHVTVLLGGDITRHHCIKSTIGGSYIIAADSGIGHAKPLNITPNLWVGDFDSADPDLLLDYKDVARRAFDPDKAQSDGELALLEALAKAPETISVIGATGGPRTDHVLLNTLMMLRFARANPEVSFRAISGTELVYPLIPNQPLKLNKAPGTVFTIVPFGTVTDLTITGVRWPLENVEVEMGSTLTLSNEVKEEAILHLGDGHAIAIVQDEP